MAETGRQRPNCKTHASVRTSHCRAKRSGDSKDLLRGMAMFDLDTARIPYGVSDLDDDARSVFGIEAEKASSLWKSDPDSPIADYRAFYTNLDEAGLHEQHEWSGQRALAVPEEQGCLVRDADRPQYWQPGRSRRRSSPRGRRGRATGTRG